MTTETGYKWRAIALGMIVASMDGAFTKEVVDLLLAEEPPVLPFHPEQNGMRWPGGSGFVRNPTTAAGSREEFVPGEILVPSFAESVKEAVTSAPVVTAVRPKNPETAKFGSARVVDLPDGRRVCNRCKEPKELTAFVTDKKCSKGKSGTCLRCKDLQNAARTLARQAEQKAEAIKPAGVAATVPTRAVATKPVVKAAATPAAEKVLPEKLLHKVIKDTILKQPVTQAKLAEWMDEYNLNMTDVRKAVDYAVERLTDAERAQYSKVSLRHNPVRIGG